MATVTPTALPPRDTLPGTTSDAGCADDAPDAHGAPDTPAHTETHPHRTPSTLSLLPSTPSKSPSTSPIGGVTVPRKRAASADTDSATCTPGRKPRRLNLYEGTAEAAAARPQLRLTSEQNAVLDSAMSPEQYDKSTKKIVLVTAAAGSGKTTTAVELVKRLAALGHKHIVYVSFTRSAVQEADHRFQQVSVPSTVECRTLNSLAWSVAIQGPTASTATPPQPTTHSAPTIIYDGALETLIRTKICKVEISQFLQGVTNPHRVRAERKVARNIYKTFELFCQKKQSVSEWSNPRTFGTVWYPALLWHQDRGYQKLAPNVPRYQDHPKNIEPFYLSCAKKLWKHCTEKNQHSFMTSVKIAQLSKAPMSGTALVLDEAQDTNGCALGWINEQRRRMQVFLVGDLAQSIYSFNGAKPTEVTALWNLKKLTLTNSWRFGPNIAAAANTVLFAKEHSQQTEPPGPKSKTTWNPYRVVGASLQGVDNVTSKMLLPRPGHPVTYIARDNVGLLSHYITVLLPEMAAAGVTWKVSINGNGDNSGLKKWKAGLAKIGDLFAIFTEAKTTLPNKPEYSTWHGLTDLTWDRVKDDIKSQELKLQFEVSLIETFGDDLPAALDAFKAGVISQSWSPEDSDIVLATVHTAKGMEWDEVQVLGETFCTLARWDKCETLRHPQFGFKPSGDDVNLWYVALTRAKRVLSITTNFQSLLNDAWVPPGPRQAADPQLTDGFQALQARWKAELEDQLASVGGFSQWKHMWDP